MNQATEVYSREFDSIFFSLPAATQARIQTRIRALGRNLDNFQHHRLRGRTEYRLRVGDYRIIYRFDVSSNELLLVTLGHRRDVYC